MHERLQSHYGDNWEDTLFYDCIYIYIYIYTSMHVQTKGFQVALRAEGNFFIGWWKPVGGKCI